MFFAAATQSHRKRQNPFANHFVFFLSFKLMLYYYWMGRRVAGTQNFGFTFSTCVVYRSFILPSFFIILKINA